VSEFVERHYGDMVAILMIVAGGVILTIGKDQVSRSFGERLSGAGLMALKLTSTWLPKGVNKDGAQGGDVP
jgi:hypothetical protein